MLFHLKGLPFLINFTDEELELLLSIGDCIEYALGDYICKEGDPANEVFFLLTGKIDIVKWDTENDREFPLRTIAPGEIFAEMSHFENIERPCSIKAKEPSTLLVVSSQKVKEYQFLFNKISAYIAQLNVNRLRQRNENYLKSLQAQLTEANLLNEFGKFFIIIILAFGFGNSINQFVSMYHLDTRAGWFSWAYLFILVMPIIFFIKRFNYPLDMFGVTWKGWKRSLFEGLGFGLLWSALYIGFCLLYFKSADPSRFLNFDYYNPKVFNLLIINYFAHSYIQEFIARGVIQTSLKRFLNDKTGGQSIFITAGLFAIFHIHLGFFVSLLTLMSGLVFGFIYNRHKNLLGVTMVHFLLGFSTKYLGFM